MQTNSVRSRAMVSISGNSCMSAVRGQKVQERGFYPRRNILYRNTLKVQNGSRTDGEGRNPTKSTTIRPRAATRGLDVSASDISSRKLNNKKYDGSLEVLSLLSELIEIQALTTAFENLAGRSAMIGVFVAATAEAILPWNGIFGEYAGTERLPYVYTFFEIGAALVGVGVLAGFLTVQRKGRRARFLEPILASLTSNFGSAGAVSKENVDNALELTIESVFTPMVVSNLIQEKSDD